MNIFCNYGFIKPHKIIKLHLPSFCKQEIIPDFIMFPLYESSCTTNEKIPFKLPVVGFEFQFRAHKQ